MSEESTEPAADRMSQSAETLEVSANEATAAQPENLTPAISGPKFCGQCGAPWPPGAGQCAGCARTIQGTSWLAADPLGTAIPDPLSSAGQRHVLEQAYSGDRLALSAALKLYFSLLAVSVGLLAVSLANPDLTLAWQFTADVAFAVATVWWTMVRKADVMPQCRVLVGPQWYLIAVSSAVGTYVLASLVVHGLTQLTGMPELRYCDQFEEEGYGFGWVVFSICVFPAVFEEFAFRGVILEALRGFLTRGEAVLVSALLFAILHLSVLSIPHLCVLGIILAQLRLASGSLMPGMVMHFTHNLLVVLAEVNGNGILPW